MNWKEIGIFSAILFMMVFCNISIENEFKINEEIAKTPVYTMGTLGGLGNVAGGIIEEATDIIIPIVNITDIKDGLPLRFLSNETKEYLYLPFEDYKTKVNEIWNKLPWWKQTYYSIGTIGAPMNIKKFWEQNRTGE